ncbi:hypothetical protein BC827DRAFT_551985 [Russula dissimulans]|nr:hypothetical protein BC827DRAFT_551985 [Russula dissimulans]
MLPTPRPSSRINSRRAITSDTSRIARRVPPPLLATSSNRRSIMQTHRHPAASRNPHLPELCSRPAGSPSKIPWLSGQTSFLTLEQSEESSPVDTPRMETKSVDAQYPTRPASAEIEHEVAKGQEGRTETRDPALPPAQQPSRRQVPTAALTSFSRVGVESDSPWDGGAPVPTRKKSTITSSGGGKENRRLPARTRVPAPPPVASPPTIPPRSTRRPTFNQLPRDVARLHSPRPLAVSKWPSKPPTAGPPQGDSSQVGSAPGAASNVPPEIRALMGDIDRFAKEWMEMFNDLSTSHDRREDELPQLDAGTARIHPTVRPEDTTALHTTSSAAGKQTQDLLMLASPKPVAVSRLRTSTLTREDGEVIPFDVTAASLARWQHRDKAMVNDTPVEEKLKQDLLEVDSISASDPPSDGGNQRLQDVVPRNPSPPMTPQASHYLSPLPESPVISGSHLVETTPVAFSKELSELKDHGIDTPRRNEPTHNARHYHPAAMPSVFSSPLSTTVPLSSISVIRSSSPWVNLRGPDFGTPRPMRSASDMTPTRSSSLRGLRAIFKRTSTDGQRQRAESLKELIILVHCERGPEEGMVTTCALIRKPTVK